MGILGKAIKIAGQKVRETRKISKPSTIKSVVKTVTDTKPTEVVKTIKEKITTSDPDPQPSSPSADTSPKSVWQRIQSGEITTSSGSSAGVPTPPSGDGSITVTDTPKEQPSDPSSPQVAVSVKDRGDLLAASRAGVPLQQDTKGSFVSVNRNMLDEEEKPLPQRSKAVISARNVNDPTQYSGVPLSELFFGEGTKAETLAIGGTRQEKAAAFFKAAYAGTAGGFVGEIEEIGFATGIGKKSARQEVFERDIATGFERSSTVQDFRGVGIGLFYALPFVGELGAASRVARSTSQFITLKNPSKEAIKQAAKKGDELIPASSLLELPKLSNTAEPELIATKTTTQRGVAGDSFDDVLNIRSTYSQRTIAQRELDFTDNLLGTTRKGPIKQDIFDLEGTGRVVGKEGTAIGQAEFTIQQRGSQTVDDGIINFASKYKDGSTLTIAEAKVAGEPSIQTVSLTEARARPSTFALEEYDVVSKGGVVKDFKPTRLESGGESFANINIAEPTIIRGKSELLFETSAGGQTTKYFRDYSIGLGGDAIKGKVVGIEQDLIGGLRGLTPAKADDFGYGLVTSKPSSTRFTGKQETKELSPFLSKQSQSKTTSTFDIQLAENKIAGQLISKSRSKFRTGLGSFSTIGFGVKTASRSRQKASPASGQLFTPKISSKIKTKLFTPVKTIEGQATSTSPRYDFVSATSFGLKQQSLTKPIIGIPRAGGRFSGRRPPFTPPLPKIGFGLFDDSSKGKRRSGKRPFRFTPTLSAAFFDVKGPKPKQRLFSGFEIRPIVSRAKRSRKKKRSA